MAEDFKIMKQENGDGTLFTLYGNIDVQAERVLKDVAAEAKGPVVRFDFGNAGRVNSMGIALLLRILKGIKGGGAEIRVCGLNPTNYMLFRMTGIFLLAQPEP